MTERPPRLSSADLVQAVTAAASSAPTPRQPEEPAPPSSAQRRQRTLALLSAVGLAASAWLLWSGLSDPFPTDPVAETENAVRIVEVAREAVEEYWAREGVLPPSLAAIGLDGLPVEYVRGEGSFDLTTTDGWGEPLGYHGEPEVTP